MGRIWHKARPTDQLDCRLALAETMPAVLATGKIALILDGLDEIPEELRPVARVPQPAGGLPAGNPDVFGQIGSYYTLNSALLRTSMMRGELIDGIEYHGSRKKKECMS
jgi:hypothetical protein